MNLVVITAIIAVCGAAKLDRTYLPPSSANSAGGSPGSLQAPGIRSSEQGLQNSLPSGSYTNNFGGVVVDAASPDTRSSEGLSGLGGPRPSYGSSDSKVGDAAFRGSAAGFRGTPTFGAASGEIGAHKQNANSQQQFDNHAGTGFSSTGHFDTHASQGFSNGQVNSQIGSQAQFSSNGQETNGQIASQPGQFPSNSQGFQAFENKSERPQAAKDRSSNILALSNDVNVDSYSYGFETDNGIAVGENGISMNGIQAEGGYSYQGDDGQVYKVTYTADEGGYRPQGAHLPTPPPIPEEILKSLEQNAKEEAAGIIDDGSYDAQKYNTDGDYMHDNGGNIQYNGAQLSQFDKRPELDATAIGTFNHQNSQTFGKPGSTQFGTGLNAQNSAAFNGQSGTAYGNTGSGNIGTASSAQNNGQISEKPGLGQFGISGSQSSFNGQSTQVNKQPGLAQFGSGSQNTHSTLGHSSHGGQYNSNSALNDNAGSQSGHSSQVLSGHHGSSANGQTFGHPGTQLSSSSGLTQNGFGSQTQFGSQFGHQQNQQPSKPSFGQSAANTAMNTQLSQPQFGSSFKPQGSEAFSGASLNQDQDTQDFGKPSPQTFSGQNFNRPSAGNFNYNKSSFGQSQMNFGSATTNSFNRFFQASGQLGGQNEYLPPLNSNGQPQLNKPESSTSGFTSNHSTSGFNLNIQKQGQKDQTPDFVALNRPKPGFASASTSTSASFGQPAYKLQPAKPLNAFDTQPQSKPNQHNYQYNTQLNQQTSQLPSQTPVQFSSDSQQSSLLAAQSVSKPTAVPDAELTTPLEPNAIQTSQGSQISSQTTSSFSSFGSKPVSSSQSQAQFGFQGNSAISQQSTNQNPSPNFPTSSPNANSQFGTTLSQSAFPSSGKGPENPNGKPQLPQNYFGHTQQNQGTDDSYYYNQPSKAFSTPSVRPQDPRFPSSPSYQSNGIASQNQFFNQQSFQNSNKFSGSSNPSPVRPTSETKFSQTQGYNGITQAAISSFPSASPTSSSHFSTTQNAKFGTKPSLNQQSTFNNQGQSPGANPSFNQQSTLGNQGPLTRNQEQPRFPPKSVSQTFANKENTFPQLVNGRLTTGPISQLSKNPTSSGFQTRTQFGQSENIPKSTDGSPQQQTLTQQYPGTIYQYNKPAEILPAQTDSSSSQTIQTGITTETKPFYGHSQGNQLPNQQNPKPFSQVSKAGSKDDQNKPFGSEPLMPHLGQHSQTTQQTGIQFGSQPANPANTQSSTNLQFGQTTQSGTQPDIPFSPSTFTQPGQTAQPTLGPSSQQSTQSSQLAQTFKPFGSASQGVQSHFGSKPQFGSQTTQISQTTQPSGSFQSSQPQNGSGPQFQLNSQTFQNSQDNGYFYPKNPKPQFVEKSNNQLSQNSQIGRPQSGPNQYQNAQTGSTQTTGLFNEQSFQFNSASKPQFGVQGNQNTQTMFNQKAPNSPIQPFNQPQFGQSTASTQSFASGQATASSSASSSPHEYKPFGSQDKTQLSQTQKPDQGPQQFGAPNLKPFGSKPQENEAPNSKPFGTSAQGSFGASKPLFNSPCCQGSKDSAPAQSTDRPSLASFQGTQSFNTQSFAGKGEQFGGPRQPPRFDDKTGYHY